MKTRVFFLLAAMGLLASCAKEVNEPAKETQPEKTYITVGINPETKTYMGEKDAQNKRKVYWSNGDKINVSGTESAALEGLAADTEKATFEFDTDPSVPYNVLYPAGIYTDATHVTLPDTQEYKNNNFADGMFPMAGYSADGSSITVNHLCAVVKVSVLRAPIDPDKHSLASVSFNGRANEQVKGLFGIDYQNATLAGASNDEADKVVTVEHTASTSKDKPVVYYIVVPALEYASGFDITVTDALGHSKVQSMTASVTLEAGKLYNLAEFTFLDGVPEEPINFIEITSAEDLIAFAASYNAKNEDPNAYAKLMNNISFDATSSAEFNATGGIGTPYGGDNYFEGTIDGQNYTISGLEATVPLFAAIGTDGKLKNLNLDGTCSFVFTHANTAEGMFGGIVGYHKGSLENVSVAADITLGETQDDVTYLTALGGLAGRVTVGTLKNCEYSGLITATEDYTGTGKLIIGGLVGRFTNAGSVTDSYFKGAISNAAKITSTDKTNPYIIIGGIAGHVNGGATITSCNTTADHADEASAYSKFNGKIVNKTTVAYNSAVGGIVGELNNGTVSSCTNAATIALSIYKEGADGSRYMKTGGIVGKNNADGTITDCTNEGTVQHRSNPRLQDLGGIAGYNAGTVSGCTNNAAVNQMTSGQSVKAGRVVNLGGIIGENAATASVSDVHNTADIQISSMEDGTGSDVRMGGVIAYNEAEIDGGTGMDITNTGQVYFSPNFANQFLGYEIGGIVGLSKASVQNVKNSGYVYFRWNSDTNVASKVYMGGIVGRMDGAGTIGGCINEGGESNAGEVYLNVKAGTAGHTDIYAGGILGYTENDVTISDCSNSGYVHGGNTTKVNGKTFFTGGIVAYLKGASAILDCSNTGQVNNAQSNNTYTIGSTTLCGGIAGHVEGTDTNPITIGGTTGCVVDANVMGTRGRVGGIAGYAKYVEMTSCIVEQDINCATHGVGGLVGDAQFSTITSCSFNGEKVHANNTQSAAGQGGLVGRMDNCTIDDCYSYVTTLTNNVSIADVGTIVGISGENNTIQNCHYKPTVTTTAGEVDAQIAGSGTFTGTGNVADL